jgi:hypothetical protein
MSWAYRYDMTDTTSGALRLYASDLIDKDRENLQTECS